jgi:hypothetical protein
MRSYCQKKRVFNSHVFRHGDIVLVHGVSRHVLNGYFLWASQ